MAPQLHQILFNKAKPGSTTERALKCLNATLETREQWLDWMRLSRDHRMDHDDRVELLNLVRADYEVTSEQVNLQHRDFVRGGNKAGSQQYAPHHKTATT